MTTSISWYRITLSRQEFESGELHVLLGAFRAAYIARNGPEGMSMYGCWNDDDSDYFVYLTPRSVRHVLPILKAYSAKPSDMSDISRLSLIYGEEPAGSYSEAGFEA